MTSYGSGTHEDRAEGFDVAALLRRAIEMLENAKSMPLSASVIVPREDMRGILEACIENLPMEIRQANWMLRERTEFLAKMEREGDEILRAARERAERMVQRSELVREAQRTAQRTVDDAQGESRRLHHEAEEYVDQKLAAFEIVLERTWRTVQGGRDKLRGNPIVTLDDNNRPSEESSAAIYDQERR